MSKAAASSIRIVRTEVAASHLVASTNIRHTIDPEHLASMKASIQAKGVLQNLIAAPRTGEAVMAVFAGITRLMAIQELIAEGVLPSDYPVPVMLCENLDPDSPDAIEIAMSENMVRAQMDYVDECAAMAALAKARRSEEEIAAVFGYRSKTVHERLLIASLIPEALALIRDKSRGLAWARALTLADKTMQKQICDDIASNPKAWETGEEIRKQLTRSTIAASVAIFDLAAYTGPVITDMFEGDKLADVQMFWTLQNAAVTDLQREIEAEGFARVSVTHEPFAAWRYEDEADVSKAEAIIEVMPNGAVTVYRGKVDIQEAAHNDAISIEEEIETSDDIAIDEARPTASICEYAAAHRSALLQAELATSFRKSLEYTTIAMIGHRSASFSPMPYAMPGSADIRTGAAFTQIYETGYMIENALPSGHSPDSREREIVAMVQSLTDEQLQMLFAALVSQRAGQQRRRSVDAEDSLVQVFCAGLDVRSFWTPDEHFFSLMATEDLRRLATVLLDTNGASALRFASSKKKDLVKALSRNFEEARTGDLSGEIAHRLNSWLPGVMSFPAIVRQNEIQDAADSEVGLQLEDLLFSDAAA